MPNYLAIVEVDQPQTFIFRANRLREILGGSYLIEDTQRIAEEAIVGHPVKLIWRVSGVQMFTSNSLAAMRSVLWNIRREFDLRGLPASFVVGPYKSNSFSKDLRDLQAELRRRKNAKGGEDGSPRCPLFAQCELQGRLPANLWAPEKRNRRLQSAQSASRYEEGKQYRKNIRKEYDPTGIYRTKLKDFDDLITSERDSYLTLIKADGDGMGRLLAKIDWKNSGDLRKLSPEDAALEFSSALKETLESALQFAVATAIEQDPSERGASFPILPLVKSGDDVWILCRRQVALPLVQVLAERYRILTEDNLILQKAREAAGLTAGGFGISFGVLFAKKGFPFDAQLDFAKELEQSAKKQRKKLRADGGCVDYFWLESSGREPVEEGRLKGYAYKDGNSRYELFTRPWTHSELASVIAAAHELGRIARRKRHQLDHMLRLGDELSDLAYRSWRQSLRLGEQIRLQNAIENLPLRLKPKGEGPWVEPEGEDRAKTTALLELVQMAEILEVNVAGQQGEEEDEELEATA